MHAKRINKKVLVLISCLCTALFVHTNQLITYPAPQGVLRRIDKRSTYSSALVGFKTSDITRFFVDEHVEGVKFLNNNSGGTK